MLIKEYRVPFPATLAEYRIGMLYMISRASEEENRRTKGNKAVDVVKRERYFDSKRGIYGVYTEKVYHVRNLLPAFIKIFVPESKSILIEKAWNGFPDHSYTEYECPFFRDSFHLSIESRYVADDRGAKDNALALSAGELAQREVVQLDIASDEHLRRTPETDVRSFRSAKSERPVLGNDGLWIRQGSPVMCCYKVARLDCSAKGLPGARIERWGHKNGLQAAFIHYNRQVLCWMDAWLDLDIADVDGFHEGLADEARPRRRKRAEAATTIATEIAAETSAGLAFSFSDETNPFFT